MAGYHQEIFNVSFKHDFHLGGYCKDFKVHVPAETQELLDLYKCRLFQGDRTGGHALSVVMKGEKSGNELDPQSPPTEPFDLVFLLEAKKEGMHQYTTLPECAPQEALYFYNRTSESGANLLYDDSARDGDGKLIHETIFVYGKTFTHGFQSAAGDTITVVLKHEEAAVQSYTVSSTTTDYSVSVDASNLPSGHYILSTGSEDIPLYLLDEAPENSVFALVKVTHDASEKPFRYSDSTKYELQLERSDRRWQYYVVAKQSMGNLNIPTITGTGDPFPADINFVKMTEFNSEETALLTKLQDIYGIATPITAFESTDPLPLYEGQLSGVQLFNSTTLVVDNLPNPPAASKADRAGGLHCSLEHVSH